MFVEGIKSFISEYGPAITACAAIAAALFGLFGTWLGARWTNKLYRNGINTIMDKYQQAQEKQLVFAHENNLAVIELTHKHTVDLEQVKLKSQEDLRLKEFAEADEADRLLMAEYVDQLVPPLTKICSIHYLGSENPDADELKKYKELKESATQKCDIIHPEWNIFLRMAFLLLQLMAAARLALNARWKRPLSDQQRDFLREWDARLEPILCGVRFPGKALLNREQIEMMTDKMLVRPATTNLARPMNWAEFAELYQKGDQPLAGIADAIKEKLAFIFIDDRGKTPKCRDMQCRLAIMGLYLIKLSKLAGNEHWTSRETEFWGTILCWYEFDVLKNNNDDWYVFRPGDVRERSTGRDNPIGRPLHENRNGVQEALGNRRS